MELQLDYIKSQFSKEKWSRGLNYYKAGRVKILHFEEKFYEYSEEPCYETVGMVMGSDGHEYSVRILINERTILQASCNCPDYRSNISYRYMYGGIGCKHIAAMARELIDYLKLHAIKFRTNKTVTNLIQYYVGQTISNNLGKELVEKLEIEPKLECTLTGDHQVTFRIGNKKKYVIKDVYQFADNMLMMKETRYGKDLTVLHTLNSFTPSGQNMARFICNRTEENMCIYQQVNRGYMVRGFDRRGFLITPSTMEELFPILLGLKLSYVNKFDTIAKKNVEIECKQGNPKIKIAIEPYQKDNKEAQEFLGIQVTVQSLSYIAGNDHAYIIIDNILYQTDKAYTTVMMPLLEIIQDIPDNTFIVGEDQLGAFYGNVLKKMEPYITLKEDNSEVIEEHLPEKPEYFFYFDIEKPFIVTCKTVVEYGQTKVDLFNKEDHSDCYRDIASEAFVSHCVTKYLTDYIPSKSICVTEDEDMIYDLVNTGMEEFMTLGEVQVTDTFRHIKIKESPKISVGVSVGGNLLDLDIASDAIDFNEIKEILESYRLRKKYHRLKNGEFLQLEESSLETIAELLEGLHLSVKELTKGKMHIPAYRALYLDKVLAESEDVDYNRDTSFKGMLRNFKSIEDSDFEVPTSLKPILRTYQKTGYRWLRTIDSYGFGGILADDMGLGKTLQVIAVLLDHKEHGDHSGDKITGNFKNVDKVNANEVSNKDNSNNDIEFGARTSLIICPASLVFNWENEIQKFAPSLQVQVLAGSVKEREDILANYTNYDVLVTSYDLLKRDIDKYVNCYFRYQVIDEAQYIKNHVTQGAKAVKVIRAKTRYALTGTPIENRLSELWSIFDYLMPGFLYRYEQFKKDIEIPIAKTGEEKSVARLKKLIQPFILRRLKSSVLKDLPNKIEQITYSKFDKEQQQVYDAYVAKVKAQLASQSSDEFDKNKLKILADLTRLRQICCDPSLCYDNYIGDSAKLDTCLDLIENAKESGHKVLLFSQFTSMLSIIGLELTKKNISFYEITGETKKDKRIQLVNEFNENDITVFLISLKAGGTGLNLTGADIVIHYDPWWNVAAQNQATDRAHRIGQKNVVTVFKLIAKGTIEEKILKLQEAKKDLAEQIISGEGNSLMSMSKDDFLELL